MCDMQRICRALLTLVPGVLGAQQSAGTELWRIAATTLAVPQALATGGAAAFWNPAQPAGAERASVALEAIETAPTVGARGVLITARARVRRIGRVGLVFGSMSIGDLVRTSLSPDPDPGGIPYYTATIGANWATTAGATTLGATLAHQDTQLDGMRAQRWTLDVGARRALTDAVSVAAATHFLSRLAAADPAQDAYAGIDIRVWRGPLWGGGSDRSGAGPGREAPHAVHLLSGGVRPRVRVLRHRAHGISKEPHRAGDRESGARGRTARPRPQADERGVHGNGRAAPQLGGGGHDPHHPEPSRRLRDRRPAHHRLDRGDPAEPRPALQAPGAVPAGAVAPRSHLGAAPRVDAGRAEVQAAGGARSAAAFPPACDPRVRVDRRTERLARGGGSPGQARAPVGRPR